MKNRKGKPATKTPRQATDPLRQIQQIQLVRPMARCLVRVRVVGDSPLICSHWPKGSVQGMKEATCLAP
jgi:hypothetical protein